MMAVLSSSTSSSPAPLAVDDTAVAEGWLRRWLSTTNMASCSSITGSTVSAVIITFTEKGTYCIGSSGLGLYVHVHEIQSTRLIDIAKLIYTTFTHYSRRASTHQTRPGIDRLRLLLWFILWQATYLSITAPQGPNVVAGTKQSIPL